jgi:hypothetical protein
LAKNGKPIPNGNLTETKIAASSERAAAEFKAQF